MKNEFSIDNYTVINKGKLIARFDCVLASGLRINGVSLFESATGGRWLGFPSRKITDDAGKVTWTPWVEIRDRGRMNQFRDGVLAAIDALK